MTGKIVMISIFTFLIVLLSACSGKMQGIVQQGGESVRFEFKDTTLGYGKIKAILLNGETFKGKFIEESSSSSGTGFGTTWSGGTTIYGTTFGVVESYTGNINAVLFGNKKHTMKCKFRVSDPNIGLPSGGVGVCQISDGRVIDVQF